MVTGGHYATDKLKFSFYIRSSGSPDIVFFLTTTNPTIEFLEQLNIVPYPPPLHCYNWQQLSVTERRIALKELQDINKLEVQEKGISQGRNGREPKEWRRKTIYIRETPSANPTSSSSFTH